MKILALLVFIIGFSAYGSDLTSHEKFGLLSADFSQAVHGVRIEDLLGVWQGGCVFESPDHLANRELEVLLTTKYFYSQTMNQKILIATNFTGKNGTLEDLKASDMLNVRSSKTVTKNRSTQLDFKFSHYKTDIDQSGRINSMTFNGLQVFMMTQLVQSYAFYQTEFRQSSNGTLMTKVTNNYKPGFATGFCAWYQKYLL